MTAIQLRRSGGRDRGSVVIEAAIGIPAFLLFVGLIIFAGRVVIAQQAVQSAAADAARTASIARTAHEASSTARSAAADSLTNQHVHCRTWQVRLDTSGFATPVGTAATVTARITCLLDLADLSVPGVPGSKLVTATMTSPIDTYRER